MDTDSLRAELRKAPSYEGWLQALARVFDAEGLFFGHGTDNAADEAYWLIWHALGHREERWEERPDPALIERVVDVAARRVRTRAPLAYLLGEAWFAGLRFEVDGSVLVPRSPLAEVIEHCFEPWCRLGAGDRVLDVGTGSGCIAIAIAHHCPGVRVDATEVAGDALATARRNVALHNLEDRVRLIEADLFPRGGERYRVIISNPPYVPAAELGALPPEYRHEPAHALVGGSDGLEPTRRLLEGAGEHLDDDGVLIVEVGATEEAFVRAFPRLPVVWIEFERGGSGVFVVTAADLVRFWDRN